MTVIIGVVCIVVAMTAFIYSLPRAGRVVRFVGTNWEPYAVVAMVGLLAMGGVMIISGMVELAQ